LNAQGARDRAKNVVAALRELAVFGIVLRTVYPDAPPRVMYSVTPLGESLRPLLEACANGAGRTPPQWRLRS